MYVLLIMHDTHIKTMCMYKQIKESTNIYIYIYMYTHVVFTVAILTGLGLAQIKHGSERIRLEEENVVIVSAISGLCLARSTQVRFL